MIASVRLVHAALHRSEAESWLESWDRQQERYLPDREERFQFLVGLVDSVPQGKDLRVLDLACGPGSLSQRLSAARPETEIVAVDLDPVLLSIYRVLFPTAKAVEVDIRDEDWSRKVEGRFDAVVTATALHWLQENELKRLYRELAVLVEPGGVFLNADHDPLDDCPALASRCAAVLECERAELRGGRLDWQSWWSKVAHHPALGGLVAERNRRFANRGEEFAPPARWHLEALAAAGFSEQAVVWRRGRDAIIAATR